MRNECNSNSKKSVHKRSGKNLEDLSGEKAGKNQTGKNGRAEKSSPEGVVGGDYADVKDLFIEYLKLDKKGDISDKYYEKRLKACLLRKSILWYMKMKVKNL